MNFLAAGVTDIGIKRKVNQDKLLIRRTKIEGNDNILALICDGMGGLAKGEVASAAVADKFTDWFSEKMIGRASQPDLEFIGAEMKTLLEDINREIFDHSQQEKARMGTTASAIFVSGTEFIFIHIGDSRIYKIGKTVQQLTEDHSIAARAVRDGVITAIQARTDKRRNQLYRCIGVTENIEPQIGKGQLQDGEGFLLCCDGFWHEAKQREMKDLFSGKYPTEASLNKQIEKMIHLLISRGEKDNISAIVILPAASGNRVKVWSISLCCVMFVILLILMGWLFL